MKKTLSENKQRNELNRLPVGGLHFSGELCLLARELDVRNGLGWVLLFISVGERGLCLSRE